eukprot:TRINITY_DN79164_c0_g1_i1.p1 TRINITY_DN79164_c0_g1~~TRINITY_DN79164_c0_g1_i1.p1  ORF type:complete len:208 (+),score=67.37 TRINITY_DN79164_c0_g1_i1:1-624(+)
MEEDDDCDKPAQGSGLTRESAASSSGAARTAKKQEAVVSEFNALLSSQLTKQRQHFDTLRHELEKQHSEQLQELEHQHHSARNAANEFEQQLASLHATNASLQQEIAESSEAVAVAQRQKQQLEILNARISEEQQVFESQLGDKEKQNKTARNQRDREVAELQQEIKDLEGFLLMRQQCQASADVSELQGILANTKPQQNPAPLRGA